ncbi:MAG TPA: FRG domain-containing protein [Blastocatellia bacterium]|nr:FRG domain-containing protein [Blastocatellia bacterium]
MNEIRSERVETLDELLKEVTPRAQDASSGRFRDYAVYRGASSDEWSLLTSLDGLGGVNPPHSKAGLEAHILRNFIRHSRPHLSNPAVDEWELLALAQHHGVPTRLLDWTYSPLVAAHFATLKRGSDADRVVWKLDWRKVHEHFRLPPLAFLVQDLNAMLKERGIETLWDLFDASPSGDQSFACMLEPPSVDARIAAQSATLTLCSDKTRSFDRFLIENDLADALTRYVIPAGKVDYIRDQLDNCSVDERRLFPDLGGIAAMMRRYYSASAEDNN